MTHHFHQVPGSHPPFAAVRAVVRSSCRAAQGTAAVVKFLMPSADTSAEGKFPMKLGFNSVHLIHLWGISHIQITTIGYIHIMSSINRYIHSSHPIIIPSMTYSYHPMICFNYQLEPVLPSCSLGIGHQHAPTLFAGKGGLIYDQ